MLGTIYCLKLIFNDIVSYKQHIQQANQVQSQLSTLPKLHQLNQQESQQVERKMLRFFKIFVDGKVIYRWGGSFFCKDIIKSKLVMESSLILFLLQLVLLKFCFVFLWYSWHFNGKVCLIVQFKKYAFWKSFFYVGVLWWNLHECGVNQHPWQRHLIVQKHYKLC